MEDNNRFRVILVNPEDGANVGAVCRAMKTMGLSDLTIIGGERLDRKRIDVVAVHASDIFARARRYGTLNDAVQQSVLTAGFTRRTGKRRKYRNYSPEEFAHLTCSIDEGEVCLVFGNERTGLTVGDLNCCDFAVKIPTSPEFPSLNLSHAVQIALYVLCRTHEYNELSRENTQFSRPLAPEELQGYGYLDYERRKPVSREWLQRNIDNITADLERIGFFSLTGKEEMGRFFRDIFARALLDKQEAVRLSAIFHKLADLKIHKERAE
jgi:tRNA/rRNA methyltransferase